MEGHYPGQLRHFLLAAGLVSLYYLLERHPLLLNHRNADTPLVLSAPKGYSALCRVQLPLPPELGFGV
ncbi:hypothetical protein D1872_275920 [compost metagenome]